ncbi:3-deoxy-manno-octulosonate cytidylyltransferase [Thiocapsa imhoffii]|uniref:3-deoxy-manno-octulosonate cytidylyltransferase n=1 Tax=Thiocapsa imhoffii TaxID=382777 RepID=A0A9X0WL56_9GAMM|nr:3-deoxy-manno-octulosonate cytidylyltransferase [Thiocapsa imhoffii]MBK1646541.1 3-deoxy-manno-octulosonate cytidylyltransferase [Thiocapsa imhoffii]
MADEPVRYQVVIPARFGATRLPGKPLRLLAGKPMIQHVVERALASAAEQVVVATDDERISALCRAFGADVAMTKPTHRSGSERITEVIEQRGWDDETLIVNLQGDEPGMPALLLDQVAHALARTPRVGMATLACPIHERSELFDPNIVKVVTNAQGDALYFSRAPIPWQRDAFADEAQDCPRAHLGLRHIGLYAYRARFLRRYLTWSPAPLEQAESLEQLRVLWHGERIQVAIAATEPGPGVDTEADLARAEERLMRRAGGG